MGGARFIRGNETQTSERRKTRWPIVGLSAWLYFSQRDGPETSAFSTTPPAANSRNSDDGRAVGTRTYSGETKIESKIASRFAHAVESTYSVMSTTPQPRAESGALDTGRLDEFFDRTGTIAALLRHSTTALVKRYAHLSPSHLKTAIEEVATYGNTTPNSNWNRDINRDSKAKSGREGCVSD